MARVFSDIKGFPQMTRVSLEGTIDNDQAELWRTPSMLMVFHNGGAPWMLMMFHNGGTSCIMMMLLDGGAPWMLNEDSKSIMV